MTKNTKRLATLTLDDVTPAWLKNPKPKPEKQDPLFVEQIPKKKINEVPTGFLNAHLHGGSGRNHEKSKVMDPLVKAEQRAADLRKAKKAETLAKKREKQGLRANGGLPENPDPENAAIDFGEPSAD